MTLICPSTLTASITGVAHWLIMRGKVRVTTTSGKVYDFPTPASVAKTLNTFELAQMVIDQQYKEERQ